MYYWLRRKFEALLIYNFFFSEKKHILASFNVVLYNFQSSRTKFNPLKISTSNKISRNNVTVAKFNNLLN